MLDPATDGVDPVGTFFAKVGSPTDGLLDTLTVDVLFALTEAGALLLVLS